MVGSAGVTEKERTRVVTMRIAALLLFLAACASGRETPATAAASGASEYLYLWTGSADSTAPDFLAVLDVRASDTSRYGTVLTTLPVPGFRNGPHHTEHQLAADGQLFANGFGSGKTFIFDVRDGAKPRIAAEFGEQAGYGHPHSFLRLPNGNVLSTFQMHHGASGLTPGGLVEMTPAGAVVRSSSAMAPDVPSGLRPYSGAIVPALDRIVTTTTDMDPKNPYKANQLQIWRLSTLELLHTITLPHGPLGDEGNFTAEPRLLPDGRTVLVSTFNCGLYLLEGLEGDAPAGRLVASFPRGGGGDCAIPVVSGRYLLITVPSIPAVVSLDVSDPSKPREASRLTLGAGDVPHWIALEPSTKRLVITGYEKLKGRVLLATFDSATGALSLDARFGDPGSELPGLTLAGRPHGAVFGAPRARTP